MLRIFKKKSEKEKLQQRYEKLMAEAYDLSRTNRKLGDAKYQEADIVMQQLENFN